VEEWWPDRGRPRTLAHVPELREPLSPDLRQLLRRAVLDHAQCEHRSRYRPLVHVGTPGVPHHVVAALPEPDEPPHDHALRVDVLTALVARTARSAPPAPPAIAAPLVWLTRSGDPALQDVDAVWLAAARAAWAEAGLDLTMVVVDRHGWHDPRTGTAVRWRRLRER
jgi:hypothetical protein